MSSVSAHTPKRPVSSTSLQPPVHVHTSLSKHTIGILAEGRASDAGHTPRTPRFRIFANWRLWREAIPHSEVGFRFLPEYWLHLSTYPSHLGTEVLCDDTKKAWDRRYSSHPKRLWYAHHCWTSNIQSPRRYGYNFSLYDTIYPYRKGMRIYTHPEDIYCCLIPDDNWNLPDSLESRTRRHVNAFNMSRISVPTLPPHTRFGAGFRPFSASLTNYTVRTSFARTRKFCGKDNYFFIPFKKFTFN